MPLHTIIEEDPIQRVHLAMELLNKLVHQALHVEGRPVLLLLSGSAEPALFRTLDCLDPDNLAKGLTISMLDDRYSRSAEESSFLQLTKHSSYEDARDDGVRFISPVPQDTESPHDVAARMHREIYDWRLAYRDGKIIATIGIGANGSVAGIQPTQSQSQFESVGSDLFRAGPSNRIIPTVALLTEYLSAAVVCTTEETEWALRELDKEAFKEELFTLPARVFYQMKDVHLFREAASLL